MASGQGPDATIMSPVNGIRCHEQPLGSELGAWGVWEDYRQSLLQDQPPPLLLSEASAHHCSAPWPVCPDQQAGRSELPQPQLQFPGYLNRRGQRLSERSEYPGQRKKNKSPGPSLVLSKRVGRDLCHRWGDILYAALSLSVSM